MSNHYARVKHLVIALAALVMLALGEQTLLHKGYGFSYQVSDSMPKGWYVRLPLGTLKRGDWVFLRPPTFATLYLQRHHWLPNSGVLLKSIQALPGDWVCNHQKKLLINHRLAAILLTNDKNDQAILKQSFCRYLAAHEYLVLGLSDERSYDSRYFGPVQQSQILGLAQPLFPHASPASLQ